MGARREELISYDCLCRLPFFFFKDERISTLTKADYLKTCYQPNFRRYLIHSDTLSSFRESERENIREGKKTFVP